MSFARYWMHNGLLGLAGEKMSKSGGNSLQVTDVLRRVRAPELRYYLAQAHYRSLLEYSEDALDEAGRRLPADRAFRAAGQRGAHGRRRRRRAPGLPVSFRTAMDDDLAVPAALAAVHASVRDGNQALAGSDKTGVRASLVRPAPCWTCSAWTRSRRPGRRGRPAAPGSGDRLRDVVGSLVKLTLQQRDAALARRDYATADAIRDGLDEIGIQVEDTPEGPRWELKRRARDLAVPAGGGGGGRSGSRADQSGKPRPGTGGHGRRALEGKGPTRPPSCAPATPPSAAPPPPRPVPRPPP